MIPIIQPDWPAPVRVSAYCTTVAGGVSEADFTSLNVGLHVGDSPQAVQHNRELLPLSSSISWLEQVHSNTVVTLVKPQQGIQADAAISRHIGVACAVMTADCVPILLCDKTGSVVAAVHAGWKGLAANIISRTVQQMDCAPNTLMAWIGPCIGQQYYQVSDDVACHFLHLKGVCTPFDNEHKCYIDLVAIAARQLMLANVGKVRASELCTYSDKRFFSHRRATHEKRKSTGRQVSVISLI